MKKTITRRADAITMTVLLLTAGILLSSRMAAAEVISAGSEARQAVAITFDDGPSPRYTPQILKVLKQYDAKATFFVLGGNVEKYPEVVKAALAAGHEIGNHTYEHPRLPEIAEIDRQRELERTSLILDLLGRPKDSRLMRPPYSDYDQRLVSYLEHTGRKLVLWTVDSGDWRGLTAPTIAGNVLAKVRNGAILIFHDNDEHGRADRSPTVAALKIILPALQQSGYRLVTVSELLRNN